MERLSLWRQGFLTQAAVLYDLDGFGPRGYVSDFSRYMRTPWINDKPSLLNDKFICHSMIKSLFGDVQPALLGLTKHGRVIPIEVGTTDFAKWLQEYLDGEHFVLAKPTVGRKGAGVKVFRDGDRLLEWIVDRDERLLFEGLDQHPYSARIFSGSLNTVRIVTMVDQEGPFVAKAIHRFGTSVSSPVDNWSAGGLSAAVDLISGALGPAVRHPKHTHGSLQWCRRHPDTGTQIEGTLIPGWEEIRERTLEMSAQLAFLPYLGWDLAVTASGLRVIEINSNTDVDLLQVHGPLLRDPRVVRFYRTYGVV